MKHLDRYWKKLCTGYIVLHKYEIINVYYNQDRCLKMCKVFNEGAFIADFKSVREAKDYVYSEEM